MKLKALNQFLPLKTNTLRFKISILYVALIGLVLILIQGVFYFNYVNSVSNEFDTQMKNKAEQIGGAVNTFRGMLGKRKQALDLAAQEALNLSIEYPQYIFMVASPEKFWLADARKLGLENDCLIIMDARGNVVAKSRNVTHDLLLYFKNMGRLRFDKDMFYKANIDKNPLRIITAPYFYAYKQGYIIAVATPYEPVERILWQHLLYVLASTLTFLVIASLVVRIFVIRILSSVLKISNVARNISQENLSERINITHADEEIEHLTGSLNEMISRLENSFAHIKEFSLEVAHEIKTPLAIISGESEMALEKDCTANEYKEIFSTILKEARRTQQYVSDLLLLTKLDYRIIKLRFEPIDLAEFLSEICEEMRVISTPQGIAIRKNIPHEPMLLKGDKTHLKRVFLNLIDNALKFTPQGGRVDVVLKRSNQKAIVLVSDTGSGIAPDDLSKIFNKFYRVDKDEQKTIPGCGLGLSIAHTIIELHRGKVSVSSELGKGTAFTIEFPLI